VPAFSNQISPDRHAVLPQFAIAGSPSNSATTVVPVPASRAGPGSGPAIIGRVLAHPTWTAGLAAGMLVVLALPVLRLHTATPGAVLGNHMWSHPDLTKLTRRRQAAQVDKATTKQRSIAGTSPCVFRPPYGSYNAATFSVAQDRRLAVWLWSVDTEDWKADGSASAHWVNRIIKLAEGEGTDPENPVIIVHNQRVGNPAIALALPTIIRFFRHHHYRLVIPEDLTRRQVAPADGHRLPQQGLTPLLALAAVRKASCCRPREMIGHGKHSGGRDDKERGCRS
jgi:peptidoglycan/xylan/chitin deacetylase (PgdA/CDA1 family)